MKQSYSTLAVLFSVLLSLSYPNCGRSQELGAKKTEEMLQFAERFLVAVSKEDPSLKKIVGYPFVFYAPCKGGTADSFADFEAGVLSRLGGELKLPKIYETRKMITIEKFIRANSWAYEEKKSMEEHLKMLGKDVHVAYLFEGKKDDAGAFAVLVRTTRDGYRAIGLGTMPKEAR